MIEEKYIKIFNDSFKETFEELEVTFDVLRKNGASMADCVKLLIFELKFPLKIADEIVVNSKTWSDRKVYTSEIREMFYKTLNK